MPIILINILIYYDKLVFSGSFIYTFSNHNYSKK